MEEIIELLFITLGPILSAIAMILNLLSAYVFNTKEFKKNITFHLLFYNSLISCILLAIGIMIPFAQCRILCPAFQLNLWILIYEYYICLCIGSLLEWFSSSISFLLSMYRFMSIVIVKTKIKFNIYFHLFLMAMLSVIVNFPWFIHKKIVWDEPLLVNSTKIYKIQVTSIGENVYFSILLTIGPLSSVLMLIIEMIIDIYVFVYLRLVVLRRKTIGKLSRQQAKCLINDNLYKKEKNMKIILLKKDPIETPSYSLFHNNDELQEVRMSLMILYLSLLSLSDHIVKIFPFIINYNYDEKMDLKKIKLASFIIYILLAINLMPNTFIYYYFSSRFREQFRKFNIFKQYTFKFNKKISI
jgi:hypothetical protein